MPLFWALDRFSREGIRKTIACLERPDHCGAAFKSYTEPFLDTDNELIDHIVPGVDQLPGPAEALRILDRTKAGPPDAGGPPVGESRGPS